MKIRSDFVSNSSSSSFVFSTKLNSYALSDHINNILKSNGGMISTDDFYHNESVIRYCCEFYQLLYLGWVSFPTKDGKETIDMLHGEFINNFNFNDIFMKGWFEPYPWVQQKKYIEEAIQNMVNGYGSLMIGDGMPEIGRVTKDTLELTKKFQELYGNVHLDQSKIDAVEEALNRGDNVYVATFRDDGEGRDCTSIFVPRSSKIYVEGIEPKKFEEIFHLPVLIDLENDYKE